MCGQLARARDQPLTSLPEKQARNVMSCHSSLWGQPLGPEVPTGIRGGRGPEGGDQGIQRAPHARSVSALRVCRAAFSHTGSEESLLGKRTCSLLGGMAGLGTAQPGASLREALGSTCLKPNSFSSVSFCMGNDLTIIPLIQTQKDGIYLEILVALPSLPTPTPYPIIP